MNELKPCGNKPGGTGSITSLTERKGQVAEELKYHEARTKVLRLEYQIIQQQLITATQLPLFKEAEHE